MNSAISIWLLLLFMNSISSLKLEQVLIMGRHNIRAPLVKKLEDFSPYTFNQWHVEPGHLTPKGTFLEEHMGKFISQWLQKENLLPVNCPRETDVYIYANTRQRTRETAKAFINGAFTNCNVSYFSIDSKEMDPVFNPILRNQSKLLKNIIINEMQNKIDALNLRQVYVDLNEIVNLKESPVCKTKGVCSFANQKDQIYYKIGEEPNIIGPLRDSNAIVDSFLMAYYDGKPIEKIAWGKVNTPEKYRLLSEIAKENLNVRFNSTILAKEVAHPLLDYIYNILRNNSLKMIVLIGHDSNLLTLTKALDFKAFELPESFEPIPIGSKLIFQKWNDEAQNKTLLKINFVYQTPKQLRDNVAISENERPKWVDMKLKACPVDDNGFCPWDVFINILKNAVN